MCLVLLSELCPEWLMGFQQTVEATGQQIAYTPVDNSQGFWMFDSTSATVNGQSISLPGNKAIAGKRSPGYLAFGLKLEGDHLNQNRHRHHPSHGQ